MSFSDLGLEAELLRAIDAQGYTVPTPVQKKSIPVVLAGRDVLAGAQTGTGKTAAFTLPILQRLHLNPLSNPRTAGTPRVLVLSPTRELAAQIHASTVAYGQHLKIRSSVIFGGVSIGPQIAKLKRGVDIVIATPGRLLDHLGQGTIDLSKVEILVLDEADRMLDMGFIRDIRKVLAVLPKRRQNLLFSATYSAEIRELADGLLHRPERIEVARRNTAAETVDQRAYRCPRDQKRALLRDLITDEQWFQVLVFSRTKHGANRLARQLSQDGLHADAIHGNKSQNARTRALEQFKRGDLRVLVATDIAARGIDIDDLTHVVNFDLPNVPEDYVHRIGRTGRAGKSGSAISLVSDEEIKLLRDIERVLGRRLELKDADGNDVAVAVESKPQHRQRRSGAGEGRAKQGGNSAKPGAARQRRRSRSASGNSSSGHSAKGGQASGKGNRQRARPQR